MRHLLQLRKCPPTHRPTWASSRVIWLPSKLFCSGFTGHLLCDCLLGRHAVSLSVLPTPCALQHLLNHLHLGQNGMQLSCGSGTGSTWDLRQGLMTPHTHTPLLLRRLARVQDFLQVTTAALTAMVTVACRAWRTGSHSSSPGSDHLLIQKDEWRHIHFPPESWSSFKTCRKFQKMTVVTIPPGLISYPVCCLPSTHPYPRATDS